MLFPGNLMWAKGEPLTPHQTQSNHTMNALTRKQVLNWMYERIQAGMKEEIGSCDSLEDAENFVWHCTVNEENGKKVISFTTSLSLFPFATGYMTRNGEPRIKWN